MPTPHSFDYALIRVMPRVDRGECVNVGAVLFCRTLRYLGARIALDVARLRALDAELDIDLVELHLGHIPQICAGGAAGGPIGALPIADRFHWLVAPRSAVIQTSAVHSGLCANPAASLDGLMRRLSGG